MLISKLIESSTFHGNNYDDYYNGINSVDYFDKRLFAASVIQECIKVCCELGQVGVASAIQDHFKE